MGVSVCLCEGDPNCQWCNRIAAAQTLRLEIQQILERLERIEATICEHSWVDARNEVIESGEYCDKCHAVRAGP